MDHGGHWIGKAFVGGFWLFLDNLVVLDWSSWLRVLGGISDDGRISLDSSLIHWDLNLIFLLLSWSGGLGGIALLAGVLGGVGLLSGISSLGSVVLLGGGSWLWGLLSFNSWGSLGSLSGLILGHIFSKGFDEILRETVVRKSYGIRLLSQESNKD